MQSRFAAIPASTKRILIEVMQERRVKDPYEEATDRLGRRPTVIEWIWIHNYDYGLVFDDKEGEPR
jgi:hypothetical protein